MIVLAVNRTRSRHHKPKREIPLEKTSIFQHIKKDTQIIRNIQVILAQNQILKDARERVFCCLEKILVDLFKPRINFLYMGSISFLLSIIGKFNLVLVPQNEYILNEYTITTKNNKVINTSFKYSSLNQNSKVLHKYRYLRKMMKFRQRPLDAETREWSFFRELPQSTLERTKLVNNRVLDCVFHLYKICYKTLCKCIISTVENTSERIIHEHAQLFRRWVIDALNERFCELIRICLNNNYDLDSVASGFFLHRYRACMNFSAGIPVSILLSASAKDVFHNLLKKMSQAYRGKKQAFFYGIACEAFPLRTKPHVIISKIKESSRIITPMILPRRIVSNKSYISMEEAYKILYRFHGVHKDFFEYMKTKHFRFPRKKLIATNYYQKSNRIVSTASKLNSTNVTYVYWIKHKRANGHNALLSAFSSLKQLLIQRFGVGETQILIDSVLE